MTAQNLVKRRMERRRVRHFRRHFASKNMGDTTISRSGASIDIPGQELPEHLGLATGQVKRITLFKIPGLSNQQKLVDAYKVLEQKAKKV